MLVTQASDGGDEETRTPDPLLAKEVLYQPELHPLGAQPAQVYLRWGATTGMPSREAASTAPAQCGRFWTRTRDLCLIRAVL